jgi:hypothetical protein
VKLYLVCLSSGGAHEPDGVFSHWSTPDAAIAEAERLSALYPAMDSDQITIAVTDVDVPHDDARRTWAPDGWQAFRRKAES